MKYCKKCGAELAKGVSFCEKCGNPVGQVPKQGSSKKKWMFGICSGVIVLAVAVVGGLYAMGIIGSKDNVVQTSTDTADIQETPSVTEEVAGSIQGENEQVNQKSDDNIAEDKAYEAYMAYKAFMEQEYDEYLEENEYEDGDDGEYNNPSTWEEYDQYINYAFIYLDGDDYPELIQFGTEATVANKKLYTYDGQSGIVVDTQFEGTDISYMRTQGYLYDACRHSGVWSSDAMIQLINNEITELFSENYGNEEKDTYTRRQVAKKADVQYLNENEWSTPEFFSTIDEAYIQLMKERK